MRVRALRHFCVRFSVPVLAAIASLAVPAIAQNQAPENPVFVNDSPAAAEAILSVRDNLQRGNQDQAIRLLQRLLDEQPSATTASAQDPALFLSVRELVHELLLSDAELLARYRQLQGPPAADRLAEGRYGEVELQRLLTPAGLRAAATLAYEHMEGARFDAAARTLAQLERHPDRKTPEGGRLAAECARRLARYAPAFVELAQRWSAEAALAPGVLAAIEPPPQPQPLSPLVALPHRPDLSGLVAQPLTSVAFGPLDPMDNGGRAGGGFVSDDLPPYARELRSFPLLMGDWVFIASSRQVSAFDRFTLASKWSQSLEHLSGADPEPRQREGPFRNSSPAPVDDVRLLAANNSILLVSAASEPTIGSDLRESIAAFDTATGRLLWSSLLVELDPQLEGGHVRGPILLDASGSTAVAVVRKDRRERRLRAVYLVGIDTSQGVATWVSLVASAGSLPFAQTGSLSEGAVQEDGVVYSLDRIGVASAHEAATGRPIWVRRLDGESYEAVTRRTPWQMNAPIVRGDRILLLTPDRKQILSIDRASGRKLSAADTGKLRAPAYLLAAGQKLAVVGEGSVSFLNYDDLGAGPVSEVRFKDPGIRGRVVVAGGQLVVPDETGLTVVNPEDPSAILTAPLDNTGNFVLADNQLIVADDARLHSYFSWEAADKLLTGRMLSQPADPSPGIALAELSYRAGRDERIVAGVDSALAAIARAEDADAHRDRLIAGLRAMIDAGQQSAPPPGRGPLALGLVGDLIARFGAAAAKPNDRAAHRILEGRHLEDTGEPDAAAASYQRVLDEPALATAMWQGARLGVRAETEATRRLEQLVAKNGREVYGQFEVLADAALGALPEGAPIDSMERLARRYPVALASPRLWDRIARAYELERRPTPAARALEIGLQTAERIPGVPPAIAGELAGRLVSNLLARGLTFAADDCLRRVRSVFGQIALTADGLPIDESTLAGRIGADRAQFQRWASVGLPTSDGVQVLPGWVLMEPLVRETTPSAAPYFVMRHQDGRVAVFARGAANAEGYSPSWTQQIDQSQAELLRQDRAAAFFYVAPGKAGGSILKVDPQSGRQLWVTDPMASHFPESPPVAPAPGAAKPAQAARTPTDRIATPLEGLRPVNEVLFASDERTLVLVERTGRSVAFDADSGQRLWAAAIAVPGVYDCAVFRNVLAIAGEGDKAAVAAGVNAALHAKASTIALLDVRSGELLRTVKLEQGPIRWIRFTPRGDLIVGLSGAVAGVDVESGALTWSNTQAPCVASINAWIAGENVIIEAEGRTLWVLTTSTGLLHNAPVDVRDHLETDAAPRASQTADGNFALSTRLGLAILGSDGSIVGLDAIGRGESLIPPLPIMGGFVTMETDPSARDKGSKTAFDLHLLDARSGMLLRSARLELSEPPVRLAVTDGRLAVTTGSATIIYSAPAEPR